MSEGDGHRHPSGRPIRRREYRERPVWRIPDDGFVTPRLRRDRNVTAIGFVHDFGQRDDEDESD